jgi:malonyl-CoA/methylmalonyl-CoA synthetase
MDITISQKVAIIDEKKSYSYQFLFEKSFAIAYCLKQKYNNLKGERIAFLATQNVDYVLIQWAIWQVEAIAVPLSIAYTDSEWGYILEDTKAFLVINHVTFSERLQNICTQKQVNYYQIQDIDINSCGFINVPQKLNFNLSQKALIIYTSGTTGKPKGVVTTHQIIENQINTLIEAWQWNENDYTLLVLPLHHIHGVINILGCALQVGATLKILPKFDAQAVWECFENEDFSVFMAVPTIYHKLLQTYETFSLERQEKLTQKLKKMRLMVSGSAALPIILLEKWKNISGHTLLERYGMTEIGMAISNPYQNIRKAGKVGLPLQKVEVKLLNDKDEIITQPHQAGEIYIKSPSVFLEYWNKPKETQESFKEGNKLQ